MSENGHTATKKSKTKSVPKAVRSGLHLSISRVDKKLRGAKVCKMVGGSTSIYMTGIVEHVVKSILKQAGEHAKVKNCKRILPQHAIDAVRSDPDLARLFAGFAFVSCENVPKAIDTILTSEEQNQRSAKKKMSKNLETEDTEPTEVED